MIRERNTGGGFPFTMIVGDDLNVIISPEADAPTKGEVSKRDIEQQQMVYE